MADSASVMHDPSLQTEQLEGCFRRIRAGDPAARDELLRGICGRIAALGSHEVATLRESVRLQVNLPYELLPCLVIPLDVGSAQAGHESLDVAQGQPEFMRCSCKNVVGTGHDRFQNTGHEYLLE